jgi:hypothetical protein
MAHSAGALLASFAYVFSVIGVAEMLRRWRDHPVEFTRKFIHIGVGMWAYGTVLVFDQCALAIIPPLSFIAVNTLSYWRGVFIAMETGKRGQLGTV